MKRSWLGVLFALAVVVGCPGCVTGFTHEGLGLGPTSYPVEVPQRIRGASVVSADSPAPVVQILAQPIEPGATPSATIFRATLDAARVQAHRSDGTSSLTSSTVPVCFVNDLRGSPVLLVDPRAERVAGEPSREQLEQACFVAVARDGHTLKLALPPHGARGVRELTIDVELEPATKNVYGERPWGWRNLIFYSLAPFTFALDVAASPIEAVVGVWVVAHMGHNGC
jgi:hypothetical protein